jgi:dTDP-4-dehydrorhamnose 3,5-epimerase
MALRPTTLLYLVTNEYDGTDELGIAYDDADLAIRWPHAPTADGRPILSPRDRSNPSFAEARRLLASC